MPSEDINQRHPPVQEGLAAAEARDQVPSLVETAAAAQGTMSQVEPSERASPEQTGSTKKDTGWGIGLSDAPGTYLLLTINLTVFLCMVLSGVSAKIPTSNDLVRFGSSFTPLVLDGQWYRLVSATFVHVGWIHLTTNMWCLWNLGLLAEPLLGPAGLFSVYILSGVAGFLVSLASNVLHGRDSNVAGASGAVFGIAGILIVLLSNRRLPIPWNELRSLRRSMILFSALNLVIGGAAVYFNLVLVDNYAHVGGFLAGLAMGAPLVPKMTAGRQKYLLRQKMTFACAALGLSLFGYWIANLR